MAILLPPLSVIADKDISFFACAYFAARRLRQTQHSSTTIRIFAGLLRVRLLRFAAAAEAKVCRDDAITRDMLFSED